jgi:hypothetical protein
LRTGCPCSAAQSQELLPYTINPTPRLESHWHDQRNAALGYSNSIFFSVQRPHAAYTWPQDDLKAAMHGLFAPLWPLLWSVTPSLGGRVNNLTQQDIADFFFSLSREFARRQIGNAHF